MRLASYRDASGPSVGVLNGDGLVDLRALTGSLAPSLRDLLAAGQLDRVREYAAQASADVPADAVTYLPVIPDPSKIIGVGLNYRSHRDEASRAPVTYPTLFLRVADSQIGHRGQAMKPAASGQFDYEGELAVVIGTTCRNVPPDGAAAVLAGYSCYNDFSVRDWQRHTSQWTAGKNFTATGAFGPALVTPDEVPDLASLAIRTRVNGETRQSAVIGDLLFPIPELISYVSTFTTLRPGDVLITGTPAGVGLYRDPPDFLQAGDVVEVEVEQIGTLTNEVTDA
jgi:2-keto-4-pentenoate hydratase/2-oxohepta-3-ene-1,7-dioic acid hydratase in catechol pathway